MLEGAMERAMAEAVLLLAMQQQLAASVVHPARELVPWV
jgi:hypothetical protein